MGPTNSEVHVNRPLSSLMLAYMQDASRFISDKVFPNVPVLKQSDMYFDIPKDAWFRAGAVERAPATESVGINYDVNPNNAYFCKVWAAHFDLADQIRANYDTPLNADELAMRFVADNLLNTRELHFMQRYMQPGVWSGANASGSTVNQDFDVVANGQGHWDLDNSDPIEDIRSLSTYVQARTGKVPNTLTLSKNVYDKLCNNKTILDRIRFTQTGLITQDLLRGILEVDRIFVAQANLNTSQVGRTANMGFMVSNCALLTYAPSAPSIIEPSAGYTFSWTGFAGAQAYGNVMKTFRMENLEADRYEGKMAYDQKITGSDLGVFCTNVLSSATP